jgi:hypothetical protein
MKNETVKPQAAAAHRAWDKMRKITRAGQDNGWRPIESNTVLAMRNSLKLLRQE